MRRRGLHPVEREQHRHSQCDREQRPGLKGGAGASLLLAAARTDLKAQQDLAAAPVALGHFEFHW